MSDGKLPFATLVSTPSSSSWSQAYNAGRLFAVLSLENTSEEDSTKLASTGKDIINALVEEYFTLEVKNLDSIKTAITQTVKKIHQDTQACFVVVSIVQNILYAFSVTGGKILLKRGEKIGTLLQTSFEEDKTVHAVSGYMQEGDTIIIQTKQFAQIIQKEEFSTPFSSPSEAAEILSPKVHQAANGGAAAVILTFHDQTLEETPSPLATPDEKTAPLEEETPAPISSPFYSEPILQKNSHRFALPKVSFSFPKISLSFSRKKLLLFLIPLILLIILAASMYAFQQQQENNKRSALFADIYPKAEKSYEQGAALVSLNKQLARNDFLEAKKIIEENLNAFPKDSTEYQKMQQLLSNIEKQGVNEENSNTLEAKEVNASQSPMLSSLIENPKAVYATSGETIYLGSNEGITDTKGKMIIKNDGDWKQIAGIGTFGTNLYVLDKSSNQILKYLNGAKASKSVYASGSFSDTIAITIDGSIYVLNTDGSIKKFTRGKTDTFTLSELPTPLKNPTRIFTSETSESLYILDPGSAQIVELSKNGTFQNAYTATIIKDAKDFDVHETDNKIYVLANKNVYEITIP